MDSTYEFAYPSGNGSSIIKVIGVGGGGSNAVNHMYKSGIKGVDFFVCNTDAQALQISPVPNKIQLGLDITQGLGAGAKPEEVVLPMGAWVAGGNSPRNGRSNPERQLVIERSHDDPDINDMD